MVALNYRYFEYASVYFMTILTPTGSCFVRLKTKNFYSQKLVRPSGTIFGTHNQELILRIYWKCKIRRAREYYSLDAGWTL